MPGSDTLIAVDPARYRRVVEAFATWEANEAWIQGVFQQFEADFDRFWDPTYATELQGSDEDRTFVLNEVFSALLGEGECLDTSLDLLLSIVGARNPDLQPLRELIAALEFDVELPAQVQPGEFGLLGVWSARGLREPLEQARRFASREGVEAFFAGREYGIADTLRGVPAKDRALEKEWLSEGFWPTWKLFIDLLAGAVRSGSHLALVSWD